MSAEGSCNTLAYEGGGDGGEEKFFWTEGKERDLRHYSGAPRENGRIGDDCLRRIQNNPKG